MPIPRGYCSCWLWGFSSGAVFQYHVEVEGAMEPKGKRFFQDVVRAAFKVIPAMTRNTMLYSTILPAAKWGISGQIHFIWKNPLLPSSNRGIRFSCDELQNASWWWSWFRGEMHIHEQNPMRHASQSGGKLFCVEEHFTHKQTKKM